MLTLHALELYLQKRETAQLRQVMIQNYEPLLKGLYPIKEEINRNIGAYMKESFNYRLGIRTHILVKTRDDRILYPSEFKDQGSEKSFSDPRTDSLHYVEVAEENYSLLNEGLVLTVDLRIKHNSWLSNSILIFYVFMFLLLFLRVIRREIRQSEEQEAEQKELIQRLSNELGEKESKLRDVESKERDYLKKIGEFRKEKQVLSKDVDVLLEELEKLENGIETERNLKVQIEGELVELRAELDRLKERLEKPKKKKKLIEVTSKRFRVLYKNLTFTERAVEGFHSLSDEFQLKAEEVIHRLNEDDSLVPVKRKVFGKGGKMNILEVDFSYSGRIYFQKDSQPRRKILAIGTKNTQDQDFAYIEGAK